MAEDNTPRSVINPKLIAAMENMLDEVFGKPTGIKKRGRKSNAEKEAEANGETGAPMVYTLEEKRKLFEAATKFEAMRLKVDSGDEGDGFNE